MRRVQVGAELYQHPIDKFSCAGGVSQQTPLVQVFLRTSFRRMTYCSSPPCRFFQLK